VCSNGHCAAPSGPTGCYGLLHCLMNCRAPACRQACRANATPQALSLYDAIGNCAINICLAMGLCTSASDLSPTCSPCYLNTEEASCKTQLDACLADMP
jgi:hypothetical protein